MPRHLRPLALGLALSSALALSAPAAASADGGRACGPSSGHPSCTILRPVRDAAAAPGRSSFGAPECIVLVAGLGSPVGYDDGSFAPLLEGITEDPRFTRVRFGFDAGTYDTYGAISRNGEALRSLIHHLSSECRAIHVVTHSMGGAVADRALSKGDPANDGVVTYVALSGPHNGATAARAVRAGIETDPVFAAGVSALTRATGVTDPTTDAVRDLARLRAPRPVRDVEAVRLRLVTDEFVLRRDNADRRVDVREYMPASRDEIEGHGGIVHNDKVQQVVRTTIATHRVPPETRSASEIQEAALASMAIDAALAEVEDAARIALVTAAFTARSVFGPVSTALSIAPLSK